MAADLLVLNDKRHVAEFFLIKNGDEVLLEIVVVARTHHVVGVSVVLGAGSFFGDGCKAANADVLEALIRQILLVRGVQGVVSG